MIYIEELEGFLQEICKTQQIDIHEIGAIASIDVKKEEKGIWELSRRIGADFEVFTRQELEQIEEGVTASEFVKETVGVDNVCERSAVFASGNGRLIQKKKGENGVTTAVAAREWRIHFE